MDDQTGTKVILYTEVKTIECTQDDFKLIASEWGNLVNNLCENPNKCTSDINYYESYETARLEYEKVSKAKTRDENIVRKKISFKTSLDNNK